MLSIESSNVSSFSIYHIHELSCPRRPPAQLGDDNTPSTFYSQGVKT